MEDRPQLSWGVRRRQRMDTFTRSQRKELRRLAGLAYERELGVALAKLEARFADWRAGTLSPFDLSHALHEFHQGEARQLYNFYGGEPSACVAYALASGVLAGSEVSAELSSGLQRKVEFYRTELSTPEPQSPAV